MESDDEYEGDDASDERRLFGERRPETAAAVASDLGLTRVALAGDRIGRFSLAHRCHATGVATNGHVVVGTDEDVCLAGEDSLRETGFGPATAVGVAGDVPLAAGTDGQVGRLEGGTWQVVGTVSGPRGFAGDLLAADDGVYRVGEDLTALGLANVRDVTAGYAVTDEGIYRRAGGEWTREDDRACSLVHADDEGAVAVAGTALLERVDGAWERRETPVEDRIVAIARGESLYALTGTGSLFVRVDPDVTSDGQGGWRSRALGVGNAVGLALL